jgi:glycosyltransferase involved in cell wall biosynthesis
MVAGPRSVLIVESRAHIANGHFSARCAQLAEAYAELGYDVELLTRVGWARADEHPAPPFTVREWRPWTRPFRRTERPWVVTLLEAIEIRGCARRPAGGPDLVVMLAWSEIPELMTVLAPRRARWAMNHWSLPQQLPRSRVVDAAARWRERRRRASGGKVRVVVAHEFLRDAWHERVPFLDPVVAPIVGVRELALPARRAARTKLGLPHSGKLALVFGEPRFKRREVALEAFAALDDWTLVLGGSVADGVQPRSGLVTFPGVVDDDVRDLLFAAVDLVVLSFSPRYPNESGTLMDAIAAETPVVVSDDAAVAQTIVEPYRVGVAFSADDPHALAAAVRAAPAAIAADDLARARTELSDQAVARGQLCLLDVPLVSASAPR